MTFDIWILYVGTIVMLMSTPGPSHLLMLTNSATHGFPRSAYTAIGDLSANALQMLAAGFGIAALLATSSGALTVVKWAGVSYLAWLGLRMLVKGKGGAMGQSDSGTVLPRRTLWLQGFMTSMTNPKAIVFFAALFPQFIGDHGSFGTQFFILSLTYIVVDGLFLSAYGVGADWIARKLHSTQQHLISYFGGACMLLAAVLLAAKSMVVVL